MTIAASLIAEWVLIDKTVTRKQIKRLAQWDALYGASAIVLLLAGFTLWFYVGKPADFYSDNPVFITKIVLVVLLGLLSIKPTIWYLQNRKGETEDIVKVPKSIRYLIVFQLVLLLIIPLLAVFMAKGFGLA